MYLHEKDANVDLFILISTEEEKTVVFPYCIFEFIREEISFCVPAAHKLQLYDIF